MGELDLVTLWTLGIRMGQPKTAHMCIYIYVRSKGMASFGNWTKRWPSEGKQS